MIPKIYIETSVISYLTARPGRDLVVAAHQQITQEWWENRRHQFELFISQLVIQESRIGDVEAAQKRLTIIETLPSLELNKESLNLARTFVRKRLIPVKFGEDALHIALAAVHGMDYLLTWNCKHIANAEIQKRISICCTAEGYEPPIICTPEELFGG
jgi:predicted nucleic acid-binding protein